MKPQAKKNKNMESVSQDEINLMIEALNRLELFYYNTIKGLKGANKTSSEEKLKNIQELIKKLKTIN